MFGNISNCQVIAFGNTGNGRLWCFQNADNQYIYSHKIIPNSTGKEKDPETGYSYFGARYLEHELTTAWLSVDPMADKYPSISPYAYCAWNTLKKIDPNGLEDYTVDRRGNIKKCKDQSNSIEGQDRLFFRHARYNKDGKPKNTFVTAKQGTFAPYDSKTKRGINHFIITYKNTLEEDVPYNPYEIKFNEATVEETEKKATEVFEFLSKNTNVEWTLIGIGLKETNEACDFIITTSRMQGYEPFGFEKVNQLSDYVKFTFHPHRNPLGASDGYDSKLPDIAPNAIHGYYHVWTNHYFDFNGKMIDGPKK